MRKTRFKIHPEMVDYAIMRLNTELPGHGTYSCLALYSAGERFKYSKRKINEILQLYRLFAFYNTHSLHLPDWWDNPSTSFKHQRIEYLKAFKKHYCQPGARNEKTPQS